MKRINLGLLASSDSNKVLGDNRAGCAWLRHPLPRLPVHHGVGASTTNGAGSFLLASPASAAEAGSVCLPSDLHTAKRGWTAPASVAPGVHVESGQS